MIPVPLLDDTDFEELFEQARGLIPRFAPEWTDHTLHDPGITLLDLIAWIADAQIYRIGFVGDRHLVAFAALLGLVPQRAAPARGLIWPAGAVAPGIVSGSSRVSTPDAPDMPFRLSLDEPVHVSGARIEAMTLERPDGGETRIPMDEPIPLRGGDRIRLRFDAPLAPVGGRISLGAALDGERTAPPETGPSLDAELRAADGSGWQFVAIAEDGTAGLSRTGSLTIEIPPSGAAGGEELRLRLPAYLPAPAAITRLELNVLPVVQFDKEDSLEIGQGTGFPDQFLPLALRGLLQADDGTRLRIVTAEGEAQIWSEVADLAASGPGDRHFECDTRRGGIRFGNGINGRAPPAEMKIATSGIVRTRGVAGNLGHGRRWIVTGEPGAMSGVNRRALSGGRDSETVDELLERTRLRALERTAMISDDDLAQAALGLRAHGIGQAEVLGGVWPALPGQRMCAARTLVVRTRSGRPPRNAVDAVAAALEPRRALGERLTVTAPNPVSVAVAASVVIAQGDPARVEARIVAALASRLSDSAAGGPDRQSWPAGRPVTAGELEAVIAAVPEVRSIRSVALARSGEPLGPGPVALGPVDVALLDRSRLTIAVARGSA